MTPKKWLDPIMLTRQKANNGKKVPWHGVFLPSMVLLCLYLSGPGAWTMAEPNDSETSPAKPAAPDQAHASFHVVLLHANTPADADLAALCAREIEDVGGAKNGRIQVSIRSHDGTADQARDLLRQLEKDTSVNGVVAVDPFTATVALEPSNPVKKWLILLLPAVGTDHSRRPLSEKNLVVTWEPVASLNTIAKGLTVSRTWIVPVRHALFDLLSGTLPGVLPGIPDGITPRLVDADTEPAALLETARNAGAAILLHPWSGLTQETTERLAGEAASAGVATLSCRDPRDAEAGVLATLCGEDAPRGLARRAANILARAALNTPLPDTLRGSLPFPGQLTLNLETARTLRVALPEDLLREATLVAEEPLNPQREYTLVSAARTAAEGNLDLSAEQRKVRASSWNIPMAKANFLPQVDLSSSYVAVDEELANVANPERTWSASLKVTQLIYDEMARANVAIQKRLQAAAEQAYAGQELDIIELSAEAYVNVQLARALQRIQRTNLRQIRTYLELARRRYALGIGSEADVHRWEAALAQARIENINADKARLAANWQFNRVLNRDQGETFRVIEQPALAPELLTGPGELPDLMLDQALFEPLCAALADKALAEAPELRQLDELIAAQGKAFVALRRRYFIPTVGFQTEFRHKLDTSGKYSGTGGLQTLFIPGYPEDAWTFGLNATLPLYAGGKRRAEAAQTRDQLEQLKLTRRAAAQKLEQRARMAAAQARASLVAMDESRRAADAAQKNLKLVESGYDRGLLGIAQFVDAQTAAHVADLGAAAAEHQFLRDVIGLHRALGVMFFLESGETREAWIRHLRESVHAGGMAPLSPPEDAATTSGSAAGSQGE